MVSAALVIVGALGATVSTTNTCVLAPEVFPAVSVAVTNTEWLPCASVGAVKLHVPLVFVAVYTVPSIETFTTEPASAKPVSVGVVLLIKAALAMLGAFGAAVSIVISVVVSTAVDTLPAASVWRTFTVPAV